MKLRFVTVECRIKTVRRRLDEGWNGGEAEMGERRRDELEGRATWEEAVKWEESRKYNTLPADEGHHVARSRRQAQKYTALTLPRYGRETTRQDPKYSTLLGEATADPEIYYASRHEIQNKIVPEILRTTEEESRTYIAPTMHHAEWWIMKNIMKNRT